MTARLASPGAIYQIKVTLRDSQPLIWRRVQVSSDTMLANLDRILQCVMGWEDVHLHKFVVQGQQYGLPEKDRIGPRTTKDERQYKLGEAAPSAREDSQFRYDYDFGDNWVHVLLVEKTLPPQKVKPPAIRFVWQGRAPVLRKTWEEYPATRISSKP